ncbi:MAG TPA: tRNA (adenosine(37)-N6)-dimethylallyltransferase MiaA [Bryobacteraceae bacterium]|nr:tRNA (adenosine(37)-N6)-dimethylallyltransferase MiaA [Bryobacteraceae bacterium]
MSPLVLVLGPTGAGKSVLALDIAERFSGEIVNCDSIQLYRGFNTGAAKLPEAERRGIPHHLIDVLDPGEDCTAGAYARMARSVLVDIAARGRLPVIAGGTGFYVRALLEGLFPGPARDDALRRELARREERRRGFLHRALRRFDPAAAARIHANDRNKLIRALEVCITARKPISKMFENGRDALEGFRFLKLGLNPPRQQLYARIEERCRRMLEAGLLDEVRELLRSGVSPSAKPFQAIGYKEALAAVQGRMTAESALALMQRDTRRYAKRQITWFRRERDMRWLAGFGTEPEIRSYAFNIVANWM